MINAPENQPVTLATLADILNVSTTTISKALNGKAGISEHMVQRVRKLASEMNYKPNLAGQLLKGVQNQCIGVLMALDMTNPWNAWFVSSLETELEAAGKTMLLSVGKNDEQKERRCYEQLICGGVGGIIAGPIFRQRQLENVFQMKNSRTPLMVFNCMETLPVSYVAIDLAAGAEIAVTHLIEQGHTDIGYLCSVHWQEHEVGGTRRQGYERALFAHNLPLYGHRIIEAPGNTQSAYEQMDHLLTQHPLNELPTAFFCQSDQVAIGAMHAIQKHGYTVPRDFSIIGFDNMPTISPTFCTPLTTVGDALSRLVKGLVQGICKLMSDPNVDLIQRKIVPQLIERESVGPPRSA
jgi:DNA-binding LacI/PurR family transcriptional regulator